MKRTIEPPSIPMFGHDVGMDNGSLLGMSMESIRQAMLKPPVSVSSAPLPPKQEPSTLPAKRKKPKPVLIDKKAATVSKTEDELPPFVELVEVDKKVASLFGKRLLESQEALYKRLLLEVVPIDLALPTVLADVQASLRLLTGMPDVELPTRRFTAALTELLELKVIRVLGEELKSSPADVRRVIARQLPLKKESSYEAPRQVPKK